jgi:protein FAM32A
MAPSFVGGALSFKGDKKKKRKTKHSLKAKKEKQIHDSEGATKVVVAESTLQDEDLTEAERKAVARKLERERKELERVAKKSHRERVEEFNEKLSSLTEHNDIPRVSAAGNG